MIDILVDPVPEIDTVETGLGGCGDAFLDGQFVPQELVFGDPGEILHFKKSDPFKIICFVSNNCRIA